MIRVLIAVAVVIAAIAAAFTPTTFGADIRRAAAVYAVQANLAPVGVALFAPLAEAGDPIAQNNLGVLYLRGVGADRNPGEAARLLNAAASAGLPRAQMNLSLFRSSCDTSERESGTRRLEEFARNGDIRAASFVADCLSWYIPFNSRAEGMRRFLTAAETATRTSDPDEELKFGFLALKYLSDLQGNGHGAESLRPALAANAASNFLRAAEHGRAAAYDGLSKLAAKYASFITDTELARRVAAKSPDEWIEVAAAAGHPRSRCTVGVKFATTLAEKGTRASDDERQKLADLFQTCLKDVDPRRIILKDGKEHTIGHYRLYDVWMMDEVFLIVSPKYENHDHDFVAQEDAVARIVKLAQNL